MFDKPRTRCWVLARNLCMGILTTDSQSWCHFAVASVSVKDLSTFCPNSRFDIKSDCYIVEKKHSPNFVWLISCMTVLVLHAGSNREICDKVADISISLKNGERITRKDDNNGE